MVLKTEGIGSVIRTKLSSVKEIKAAFIYGSYASGDADHWSDLDLMVIGSIKLSEFAPIITQLEQYLKRPINYLIYSEEEWKTKLEGKDPFAINVIQAPRLLLIGVENAL